MGLYRSLPDGTQDFDVIIAGGGTAGCVIASRLSDADPNLSILLIEGGRDNYLVPFITHPLLWQGSYNPADPWNLNYKANKEDQLLGRQSSVDAGGSLGGGSSLNLMIYSRAQTCDYDSWNTKGWTTDDLLPFIKKFETYHSLGKKEHHGHDGPVHVSNGPFRSTEAEDDILSSMKQLGYSEVEDLQDFHSLGVARLAKYVSPEGKRQDAAHTYLHPKLQDGKHPNLHVLVETQVVRVLFDGDHRASGIEVRSNPATQSQSTIRQIKASKLVVLSCGALGSPPVLERSGIGNPQFLHRAGIPLIVDLPGVGHDYQDHTVSIYEYKSSLLADKTTDTVWSFRADIPKMLTDNDEMLGWNGIDISSKIRPTEAEIKSLGPRFEDAWGKSFQNISEKPLVSMFMVTGMAGGHLSASPGQYFSIGIFTAYPFSRGHVHITGPSVDDSLDFDTGFLTDKDDIDLATQVWAYKKQREVVRRMKTYRGAILDRHPQFPPGSKAANSVDEGQPQESGTIKNIEYTTEDDKAIEQWIRQHMTTCWHGIGTCKMASKEKFGVVDENLNVYGVQGLKVADLSIAPENVCNHTMSTALMIGEKAADIFIKELGLQE